ncbi:hypothetical protein EON68_02055, partial [archaeon]
MEDVHARAVAVSDGIDASLRALHDTRVAVETGEAAAIIQRRTAHAHIAAAERDTAARVAAQYEAALTALRNATDAAVREVRARGEEEEARVSRDLDAAQQRAFAADMAAVQATLEAATEHRTHLAQQVQARAALYRHTVSLHACKAAVRRLWVTLPSHTTLAAFGVSPDLLLRIHGKRVYSAVRGEAPPLRGVSVGAQVSTEALVLRRCLNAFLMATLACLDYDAHFLAFLRLAVRIGCAQLPYVTAGQSVP